MKQNTPALMVLLLILLSSCGPKDSGSGLNTKVYHSSVPQFKFSPSTYCTSRFEFYNADVHIDGREDTLQFCQCTILRDKITINIHDCGGLASNLLTIEVADSTFISRYMHTSDVKDLDETASAIEQELTLSKLNPVVGDTLSGRINFTGLSISGYSQKAVSKIKMQGSFSCVLKNEK